MSTIRRMTAIPLFCCFVLVCLFAFSNTGCDIFYDRDPDGSGNTGDEGQPCHDDWTCNYYYLFCNAGFICESNVGDEIPQHCVDSMSYYYYQGCYFIDTNQNYIDQARAEEICRDEWNISRNNGCESDHFLLYECLGSAYFMDPPNDCALEGPCADPWMACVGCCW